MCRLWPPVLNSILALFLIPMALGNSTPGNCAEDGPSARLFQLKDSKSRIQGLTFFPKAEFQADSPNGPTVKIRGRLNHETAKHWNLLQGRSRISRDKDGLFQLEIPVHNSSTQIDFVAIGPRGDIQKESIGVYVSQWTQIQKQGTPKATSNWSFSLGAGPTLVRYTQEGLGELVETTLTVKTSVAYRLSSAWTAGGSLYYAALPLSVNMPDLTFQFLGTNLRLGYETSWLPSPWTLGIQGGVYYATSFATSLTTKERFGYANLAGPQIYPVLRRRMGERSFMSGYFKYSPIMDGMSVLSLNNAEVAFGLGYTWRPQTSNVSWGIGTDFSQLTLLLSSVRSRTASIALNCYF